MKRSFSQIGQDLFVIEKVYNGKRNGFFVDIGATAGIRISNTYLLEKDFGWKGICIEPNPNFFKKLKKNRKATCLRCAVYSENDKEMEFAIAGVLSGILDHIDFHKSARKREKISVKTKTLTRVLNEQKAPTFIDYLSLDTEGSELEVLRGIDFEKYTFGCITVEHNWVEPRRTEMKDLLLNNGYVFCRENKHDDYYIHKSISVAA
jgi:FkbM family methyltransferase